MNSNLLKHLPKLLIYLRCVIAFILLIDSLDKQISLFFVPLFAIAFLSDVFDGIVARKMGVLTDSLRRFDSLADFILYTCIAISAWLCHRELFAGFEMALFVTCILQMLSWFYSVCKFKRLTSYHSYLAKVWGITLFVATITIFALNYSGWILMIAIITGCLSIVEDMIITSIIPTWKVDILSIFKALELKKYWNNQEKQ